MNQYINDNFNKNETSEIAKTILSEVDQFIIIVFQPVIIMITNIFSAIFNSVYAMFNGVDPSYSDENFATDEELTILKDETYYLTPFLTPRQIEDNYKIFINKNPTYILYNERKYQRFNNEI